MDSEFSERRYAIVEVEPGSAHGPQREIIGAEGAADEIAALMEKSHAATRIRRDFVDAPVVLQLHFRKDDGACPALQIGTGKQPAELERNVWCQRARSANGDIPRVAGSRQIEIHRTGARADGVASGSNFLSRRRGDTRRNEDNSDRK